MCTENRYDIGGFLSPNKNETRCLMNLKSKKEVPFEIDITSYEGQFEVIGKYAISKSAFENGNEWVKEHLQSSEIKFVVIDEIGPLELQGKGFAPCLRHAIENKADKNLILVVRKSIHDKVVEEFGLSEAKQLSKNGIDALLGS